MPARRPGHTRISAKNQVTLPVDLLRATGLESGMEVSLESDGQGRIVLQKAENPFDQYIGSMTGYWPKGWLRQLRDEWER